MGIHEEPKLHRWNYLLALKEDVIRLSRCLDFTQDNFGTYSLKLARIDYRQWGGESRLVYELTPESPKVGYQ
jgi:hypothetical protein